MVDPVCFTDSLVLQAPPAVFEGDSVVLRCHTKEDIAAESLEFYKNGKALELSGPSSELHIHHANRKDNGQYKCTRKYWPFTYTPSNTVRVQVQGMASIIPNRLVRGRLPMVVK